VVFSAFTILTRHGTTGTKPENNPRGFGLMGDGHLRPRAMVMGPDGRIYVGSLPPYGQVGGALGVYDPKADKVMENYRHLVQDQGISALCVEATIQKIFGGSSTAAGGGGKPTAKECVIFSWDWKEKRKERGKRRCGRRQGCRRVDGGARQNFWRVTSIANAVRARRKDISDSSQSQSAIWFGA
jgi:hypothetical protein